MYAHIRRNPRFTELVAKRTRFAGILAAIVLIIFYGFVLLVAFAPELIGKRLFEGSNLTFGILAGLPLSLALLIYRSMKPRVAVLGRHPDGTWRDAERFGLARSRGPEQISGFAY